MMIDIERAKDDAALSRSAACFLGQSCNRIGQIMPTRNATFIGQSHRKRADIAVDICLLGEFQ